MTEHYYRNYTQDGDRPHFVDDICRCRCVVCHEPAESDTFTCRCPYGCTCGEH